MTNEPADLTTLWQQERDNLVRYVERRANADIAEDVVQDVFLRVMVAMRGDGDAIHHVRGYIYRSARNLIIDGYRARELAPETVDLDAPIDDGTSVTHGDMLASFDPSPHEICEERETCAYVRRLVRRLNPEQRLVIERSLDGYEYEEIAAELDRGYEATKAIHLRARRNLERFVNPEVKVIEQIPVVHYMKRKRYQRAEKSPLVQRAKSILLEHGAMTAAQLAHKLGNRHTVCSKMLRLNSDTFTVVAQLPSERRPARGWGLVGIHDKGVT